MFNLTLFAGGLVLTRYQKSWLLILSLCSFGHLILDEIWNRLAVLLWPLLGPLPVRETTGWLSGMIQALFSRPGVYVPEIIGLALVLLFTYRLVTRKKALGFFKYGAIQ